MTRWNTRMAFISAAILLAAASCDSLNLGALAAFFGPGMTVVIENRTDFTAVPDMRISDSRNIAEDAIAEQTPLRNFGANGSVGPRQTVTLRLACDGDLERFIFRGADFREGNGFALGDVNSNVTLRRDTDFDCGDTVRITLSGAVFRFRAEVNVEPAAETGPWFGGNQHGDDGEDEDMADWLDDLFD